MLAHATLHAARLHDALVLASLTHGVLDLHALITTRMQMWPASGLPPPSAAQAPWALRDLTPACFAARELRFAPPGEEGPARAATHPPAQRSFAAVPDAAGVVTLSVTLPHALRIVDALCALGTARLWRHPADDAAQGPQAWAHLSRHERATLAAALATPRWPTVALAPAYAPAAAYARGSARGERLAAYVRAHGPAAGRVFLWLGPPICTDLLSPYARDVGGALMAAGPAAVAQHLGNNQRPAAHAYGLAAQLMQIDPALQAERARADASVGIAAVDLGDAHAECIALGALDAAACDPRVADPVAAWAGGADVLLRVPYAATGAPGFEAAGLLDMLSTTQSLAGVAVCVPAQADDAANDVLFDAPPGRPLGAALIADTHAMPRDLDTAAALRSAGQAAPGTAGLFAGAHAGRAAPAEIAPGAALAAFVLTQWGGA